MSVNLVFNLLAKRQDTFQLINMIYTPKPLADTYSEQRQCLTFLWDLNVIGNRNFTQRLKKCHMLSLVLSQSAVCTEKTF